VLHLYTSLEKEDPWRSANNNNIHLLLLKPQVEYNFKTRVEGKQETSHVKQINRSRVLLHADSPGLQIWLSRFLLLPWADNQWTSNPRISRSDLFIFPSFICYVNVCYLINACVLSNLQALQHNSGSVRKKIWKLIMLYPNSYLVKTCLRFRGPVVSKRFFQLYGPITPTDYVMNGIVKDYCSRSVFVDCI